MEADRIQVERHDQAVKVRHKAELYVSFLALPATGFQGRGTSQCTSNCLTAGQTKGDTYSGKTSTLLSSATSLPSIPPSRDI